MTETTGRRAEMTVLSASAFESFGGAERIAVGLHRAYLHLGVDSWLALGTSSGTIERSLQIPNDRLRGPWARTILRAAAPASAASRRPGDASWALSRALRMIAEPTRWSRVLLGHEDFDFPGTEHLLELPPRSPDVLHLHNLHGGYFDIRALPRLSRAVPTILTLHDAWLLTGHCAHPLDCPRFSEGCGSCPYPEMYVPMRREASAENWAVKRDAIAASRLHVATPSRWLARLVEQANVTSGLVECRVIPNGVDTRVFSPGNRADARTTLGLPAGPRIVLFAAREVEANPFKDFAALTKALAHVARSHPEDVLLVALGSTRAPAAIEGARMVSVPFVDDPARVALYYRAADVYVHAARAENLPLAPMEAMACGIPVVASDVGGVPEVVADEVTGLLTPVGDAYRMAERIELLLRDNDLRERLGAAGRRRVLERFDFADQVEAYLSWYEELARESAAG